MSLEVYYNNLTLSNSSFLFLKKNTRIALIFSHAGQETFEPLPTHTEC